MPSADLIKQERAAWSMQFAGGMMPFDLAYGRALKHGHTVAEAQQAGAEALLDAFTERLVAVSDA